MADRIRRCFAVVVSGVNDDVIGKFFDDFVERTVHFFWIAAGKIAAPAAVDKNDVARNHVFAGKKALAARCVPGGKNAFELHIPDFERGAVLNLNKILAFGFVKRRFGFGDIDGNFVRRL